MNFRKLKIERFQETDKKGTTYFKVEINNKKEFTYLRTNQSTGEDFEKWNNNFYAGYSFKRKDKKYIALFSIEGISYFNDNLSLRRNLKLQRDSEIYQTLERLVKSKENRKIGKTLRERFIRPK